MEAASDLEKCDFGKIANEDCHKTILLVELVYSNWKNVMGVKEKYRPTVGELGLTLLIWVLGHQRYVTIMHGS